MPDMPMPADPGPEAAPDATQAPEPSHAEKAEQYMAHCYSHPYARAMCDHYAAGGDMGAPAPAVPSPTNGLPGTEPLGSSKPGEADAYARNAAAAQYARENKALRDRLEALERANAEQQRQSTLSLYARDLESLAQAYEVNVVEELDEVKDVPTGKLAAFVERRLKKIPLHYQPDPSAAPRVRVAATSGAARPEMTEAMLTEAQLYMRQGMPWSEAATKALGGAK